MKLSSKKKGGPVKLELSMTSMIDIVFLLLIFFLVTTSFVKVEKQLRPTIRVNETTTSNSTSDLERAVVDIVESDGRFVYRVGAREMTDHQELTEVLRDFENKIDGAFVQVSDQAPHQMAAAAIKACKAAGFFTVTYVPEKGQP